WFIGRGDAGHWGASGVIHGFLGYLVARFLVEPRWGWVALGGVLAVLFGCWEWGILRSEDSVSWEAHLSGLVAGLVLGWMHGEERLEEYE
ncbi:MAG: rhomboid family intramembrane serine protease, partial [Verrucomicrobiota bacterium]